MMYRDPIRKLTALCACFCAFVSLCAAQVIPQLPVTPPTGAITTQPQPATQMQQAPASHRAVVDYSGGLLSVRANNSSLNQILRDISRETGMKITGGVAEDRVFGNYGPAAAGKVLNALLDGTASNMLLVENGHAAPSELILTPRTGGVTPPNPSAFRDNPAEDRTTQTPNPEPTPQPAQVPEERVPDNEPAHVSSPTPSPVGTQQSPNGVKTPQDVLDQLLRLHNQQEQPPPPQ